MDQGTQLENEDSRVVILVCDTPYLPILQCYQVPSYNIKKSFTVTLLIKKSKNMDQGT